MVNEKYDTFVRAGHIARELRQHDLPNTVSMVNYAENPDLGEEERRKSLLEVIKNTGDIYVDHMEECLDFQKQEVERCLKCAKRDVEQGEFWEAIMDTYNIELFYLQEYLGKTQIEDRREACDLIVRKMAVEVGGRVSREG